jgi:uncharacterized membrane protein
VASNRKQIITLIEQDAIPVDRIGDALQVAGVAPDNKAWRTFIDHLLLWLGGLALAFAVLFFIAYNWDGIGRFAKFSMVEVCIILAVAAYWKLDDHKVAGKVSLLVATILLGVLLALYGQTYQTGADPWQLFFNWALLMLPWAIIGRFPAIWMVWIVLINLTIALYHPVFRGAFGFVFGSGSDSGLMWSIFIVNTAALIVWEYLARTWQWLSERWAVRMLAVASGVPMTWLVLSSIFTYDNLNGFSGLVWAIWLGMLYFVYRVKKPDLFMLAGTCLSGIVVVISFVAKHVLDGLHAGGFLLLALMVVGMGTGAAVWLRNIHREWQS